MSSDIDLLEYVLVIVLKMDKQSDCDADIFRQTDVVNIIENSTGILFLILLLLLCVSNKWVYITCMSARICPSPVGLNFVIG